MSVPPCTVQVSFKPKTVAAETNLDVRLGLIGDLHNELCVILDHVLQDSLIDTGRTSRQSALTSAEGKGYDVHRTQVIRVGDK